MKPTIYEPDKNTVMRYGKILKIFNVNCDEHYIFKTFVTIQNIDRWRSRLYLLQKRPHNSGKNDVVLLGVVVNEALEHVIKTHKMPPSYPMPIKTTGIDDKRFVIHPEIYNHLLSMWVWDANCRDCYETSFDYAMYGEVVVIRQGYKPSQHSTRENVIHLGYGGKSKNAIDGLLMCSKSLLSTYTIPQPNPVMPDQAVNWNAQGNYYQVANWGDYHNYVHDEG